MLRRADSEDGCVQYELDVHARPRSNATIKLLTKPTLCTGQYRAISTERPCAYLIGKAVGSVCDNDFSCVLAFRRHIFENLFVQRGISSLPMATVLCLVPVFVVPNQTIIRFSIRTGGGNDR